MPQLTLFLSGQNQNLILINLFTFFDFMLKLQFLCVVFLLGIWACSTKTNDKTVPIITFTIDSLNVKIDTNALNSYYVFSVQKNTSHFIGYNNLKHSLDLFDLEKKKYLRSIVLAKEGPNQISEIRGIDFISSDSIFVSDQNFSLKIVGANGQVKSTFNLLNSMTGNPRFIGEPIVNQYVRLQYLPKRKSIIFFSAQQSKDLLKQSIFAEFNLQTGKLKPLPIYFSEYYQKNEGKFGFMSYANCTPLNDSLIIYNFLYEKDIYTLNLLSNTIRKYQEPNSSFIIGKALTVGTPNEENLEKLQIHAIENPHYFQVLVDDEKELFYRFSWEGIPYEANDKTFKPFMDKNIVLSVFDKNLNLIGETKLKANTYMVFSWFVTKEGIYIGNTHPKNNDIRENILSFHLLKIDTK